jgi:putative hydrolase of the HAD superfamily
VPVEALNSSPRLPEIRAVILDYGEVLCLLPTTQDIERFARLLQMDPETFLAIYLQSRRPYDRGDLLPAEYWEKFAAQAGAKFDPRDLEEIRQLDVDMWSRHDNAMIDWIGKIHAAGYKTAILSNMPPDMVTHVRNNFPWINHFDHHIFSADVRSAKPEPAIYQHCIDALGVHPSEALFIDDRDENLDQARTAGLRTLRFESVAKLRTDLQKLGFTVLPQ